MSSWQLGHHSNRVSAGDYEHLPRPKGVRWGARVIIPMGDGILAVQHKRPEIAEPYWVLAGGGIHKGETIPEAGAREVREETSLEIRISRLLYIREFYDEKIIEFYMLAEYLSGSIQVGTDPELDRHLIAAAIISWERLKQDESLIFYPIVLRKRLRRDIAIPPTTALYLGHTP
jgi:8-oxo-dGTP pyrophosphatase MutT (NUDIX family)